MRTIVRNGRFAVVAPVSLAVSWKHAAHEFPGGRNAMRRVEEKMESANAAPRNWADAAFPDPGARPPEIRKFLKARGFFPHSPKS